MATSNDGSADAGRDVSALDAPVPCGASFCHAGQACCAATSTCYDAGCLACCMEPIDAGRICTSASQCNTGEDCIFAVAGCGGAGVCETHQGCGRVSLPYCGCDGATFFDTCEGPGAPWVSSGACPDAGQVDVVVTGDSGGGPCSAAGTCSLGLSCCGGSCMNLENDPWNCGACGHACNTPDSMCLGATCQPATCAPTCGAGRTCCSVQGAGPVGPPSCYQGATCPVGCPACL